MTSPSMDLTPFAEAKVDRVTADDLIGGPRTIRITKVTGGVEDGKKQAIINFEGDEGKPFKPCKTCVRVMMAVWGKYASEYVGRQMTLYRDPAVTFGALATGGVRISHMSHLDKETVVIVATKKGKKGPITIKPLSADVVQHPATDAPADPAAKWTATFIASVKAADSIVAIAALKAKSEKNLTGLAENRPELRAEIDRVVSECEAFLSSDAPADPADEELGW